MSTPGDAGLAHWSRMRGAPPGAPVYALIDRRQDGRPRIVSEHRDPQSARAAADVLRAAGAAIEVVLLSTIKAT